MRLLTLLSLLLVTGAARAQVPTAPAELSPGTQVRIEMPSGRLVGELIAMTGDTLVVGTRRQRLSTGPDVAFHYEEVRVPRAQVQRLFQQTGHEPLLRAAVRDGAWGALLGVAFITVTYLAFRAPAEERAGRATHAAQLRVSTGLVLFAAGAVYGTIHPRPRWTEVSVKPR